VRIVVARIATAKLIEEIIREDLYFRISAVPRPFPLRERGEDVLMLAQHFLRNQARVREARWNSETRRRGPELPWPATFANFRIPGARRDLGGRDEHSRG